MNYRIGTAYDFPEILSMRLEFSSLMSKEPLSAEYRVNIASYLKNHIQSGTLIPYLAEEKGKIYSIAILCIYQVLPSLGNITGKTGLVLNVYTRPPYRRQGHSRKLMELLIADAKKKGIHQLVLSATEDGFPLYESLGFNRNDREMILLLP